MSYVTEYYRVSGLSLDKGCCFLSQRYDPKRGYKPREAESMLVTAQSDPTKTNNYKFNLPMVTDGWITDVWMSDSGTAYLARSDRAVSRATGVMSKAVAVDQFEDTELPASLFGIWGVNDKCVFAWGDRTEKGKRLHPVFLFDGKKWKELPSPGFEVLSMHGLSEDFVYAAGHDSGIALWDGTKWKRMKAPGPETYTSIFVDSRDEAYAVGVNNFVVEGSKHGWAKVAQGTGAPIPFAAVAKWNGELWIGGGTQGLIRRVKKTNKLEVVKPNIHARGFDVRKNLIIVAPDKVVETANGKDFVSFGQDIVLNSRGRRELNDFVKK